MTFANKVVVITGGVRGIGRAIAEKFHQAGATVCLVDRDGVRGREAIRSMGSSSLIEADLASGDEIKRVARQIEETYGRLDVLVNNAGIEHDQACEDVTPQLWESVMAVNLRAPMLLTQALLSCFHPSGGAIVNITSIHAFCAFPKAIPYACSKAGLLALTRNLALELAGRKIRVNAVCPGYIDTQLWDEYLQTAQDPERLAEETRALHPLGRRGIPDDVAGAVLFLAGTSASFITGAHLVLDGGLTIRAHP